MVLLIKQSLTYSDPLMEFSVYASRGLFGGGSVLDGLLVDINN